MRQLSLVIGCGMLLGVSRAGAQTAAATTTAVSTSTPESATSAPAATPAGTRRDPRGVKGVSPFWEEVGKGDSAIVARDFDAAIAAYRVAISKQPKRALGHYRLAQAQELKGDFEAAELAYNEALRSSEQDSTLKGKLLFCLANLSERAKNYDVAIQRWSQYEQYAQEPTARTFPASASERRSRIALWQRVNAEAAAVKERIDRRLKEAEEGMRKSSK